MKIRKAKGIDFELIQVWWKRATDEVLPIKYMPKKSTFMAYNDEHDLVAMSVVHTNSGFCIFETLIGNPFFPGNERKQAVKDLMDYCVEHVKSTGVDRILALTKEKAVRKYLEKFGFKFNNSHYLSINEV